MTTLSRWLAPAVLAAGLGAGALVPAPARAQDDLTRVLVDIADVVIRGGQPYYRYGNNYGYDDRLIVQRDRYGRPIYYRNVYRAQPPYGNAYGYYNNRNARNMKCNRNGKCKVEYYDPRYRRDGRHGDDRYSNDHRGRDRDDH